MATKRPKLPQARPLGFKESKGRNLVLYRHRKKREYNRGYFVQLMAFGHDADNALPYIRKYCKEHNIGLTIIECNQKMYKHYEEGRDKIWAIINKRYL